MDRVRRVLQCIAVSTLIVAWLNASAGLCFCHRGPAVPGSSPVSRGCCHGQDASGMLALHAASSCCHVEAAARDATAPDALQLAQPESEEAPGRTSTWLRVIAPVATTVSAPSPPIHVLRI
jgi:hypothetical protein